jgi:hypothetical protein
MADASTRPHHGKVTPDDVGDPRSHQQYQIFERDSRPRRVAGSGEDRGSPPPDMPGDENETVGDPAGSDTSRAVAQPAERSRPGAATKLGGTPSNLAVGPGRDAD